MKVNYYILLLLLLVFKLQSQTLTGIVFDENKETIAGAAVYLDGTSIGTITDEFGKYELRAANKVNTKLVINFIGYESKIIANPFDNPDQKIYLIPNKEQKEFELNGVILENDKSGILYHNIGVNGAKLSDYNKYPMFFEQLKALQPDLIVVSLGTNESFDHMISQDYMQQLDIFIQSIKAQNPDTEILVATPPPSLFKRKYPNTFCADYAQKTIDKAEELNYAVWDLYSQFGGLYGVGRNAQRGLIGRDKVHYTKAGYEKQGDLLADAILNAFHNYKTIKE